MYSDRCGADRYSAGVRSGRDYLRADGRLVSAPSDCCRLMGCGVNQNLLVAIQLGYGSHGSSTRLDRCARCIPYSATSPLGLELLQLIPTEGI